MSAHFSTVGSCRAVTLGSHGSGFCSMMRLVSATSRRVILVRQRREVIRELVADTYCENALSTDAVA